MRGLSVGLAIFVLLASSAQALSPGEEPPAIDLRDLAGKRVDLRGLAGSVVVIDFWASWCEPCKDAMPALESLHERYAREGVVVIGVNIDSSTKKMNRFLERNPVRFRIVHDRKLAVASKYEPPEMPSTYFIGRDGKLRHVHAGFRKGDAEKLESQIKALLAEQPRK